MFKKYLPVILKLLFPLSLILAIGIDAAYKFDIPEGARGYYLALGAYFYFCIYLAVLLCRRILKIKNWLTKILIYFCLWFLPVVVFNLGDSALVGAPGSVALIIIFTSSLAAVFLTLWKMFRLRRMLAFVLLAFLVLGIAASYSWNQISQQEASKNITNNPVDVMNKTVTVWQLNSRYKINTLVKYLKVDLDKDGKEELAAVTSYDKLPSDVFYYAGFYRYNPATEMWDEFYGDELNILNYAAINDEPPEKQTEYRQKIIDLWSTEFTTLENIGDVTGDGSPEIVFSSLIQGKYLDNNIIVAQAGQSHFRYKIFSDLNPMAKIVAEDGLIIEEYQTDKNSIKDIYEWDNKNLYFKLIDSQKSARPVSTPPATVVPGFEEVSS